MDKQIIMYPYNEILRSKKKQTIYACNNRMNLKKLRMHERAHTVWSKLYKILANANQSTATENKSVAAWDGGRG